MSEEIEFKQHKELVCKSCKKVIFISKEDLEGSYNWKCGYCNTINPTKQWGVIWNTSTGTPRRNTN
jgi:LSD1 subclass zinc finger protein